MSFANLQCWANITDDGVPILGQYEHDIWAAVFLRNGLRIGAAYDIPTQGLRSEAGGAYEVMLGYDFNFNLRGVVTPRYF